MLYWQRPKAVAQLASYLRGELAQGRWTEQMPGVIRLAEELGAARNTVEGALKILEQEGFLIPQGHGKGRLIRPETVHTAKKMRVAILPHYPHGEISRHSLELLSLLQGSGFAGVITEKCVTELNSNLTALEKLVRQTHAAAWMVESASLEMLNWFVAKGIPVFAVFGRRRKLNIAGGGPDKSEAFRQVVRELVARGHRRIILLAKKSRRLPLPGLPEQAFLEELGAQGIATSTYNLPDWEQSADGLVHLLNQSYRLTPPTAFLVDEAFLFHAVKHQLAARGIRCPEDVSLVCTDPDASFQWCRPGVAHIHWDNTPLLRHAMHWANQVRQGNDDHRQIEVPATYVPGGTVGVVR